MDTIKERKSGPFAIEKIDAPVTVYFHDDIIATTDHALLVREDGAEPVYYIPRDRVEMAFLVESDAHASTPDKGEARLWSVSAMNRAAPDAVWSYDHPTEPLRAVAGYMAFDPAQFRIEAGGPPRGAMSDRI
ncbi:DUF427 domain-containing protein [Aurantimonas sp. VKM B-3413]|uniref:DUF427 domain-containing protein n=1 Tax=Aurantimonas sp. VKM B-3413 TaxID=2779401 RepID=UPI001E448E1E|nr:DUF427 domain-containing protein [Aurantimonas sp. VKM B-3413]MCB8836552.1 DUF427 domain-containing protein [Aurantimonas sp. VKM B-3413]